MYMQCYTVSNTLVSEELQYYDIFSVLCSVKDSVMKFMNYTTVTNQSSAPLRPVSHIQLAKYGSWVSDLKHQTVTVTPRAQEGSPRLAIICYMLCPLTFKINLGAMPYYDFQSVKRSRFGS